MSVSILIVDAFEPSRWAMAHMVSLQFPHATLHVSENYHSITETCLQFKADILITDLMKSSLNNRDILSQLFASAKDIKLILTTGSSDNIDNDLSGMDHVCLLYKPVEVDELYNAVMRFIANS